MTRFSHNIFLLRAPLLCGVAILLMLMPAASIAQQLPADREALQLSVTPRHPGPKQNVRIGIESFSFNIDRSTISWFLDEELVARDPGRRTFTFQTGPVGSRSVVDVVIDTPLGTQVSRRVVVRPSHVALLWEAETYTPPFYQGKALYTPGSVIKLVAFATMVSAEGRTYTPNELVYTWEKDGRPLRQFSGAGEAVLRIINDTFIRPFTIAVEVKAPDNQIATRRIRIESVQPMVELYHNDPLLGIRYGEAVGSRFVLEEEEAALVAEPYFFAVNARDSGNLRYNWRLNNERIDADSSITLRPTGPRGGSAHLELALRHLGHTLQSTRFATTLVFAPSPSANFTP